ncbi:MAG: hypothetical protein ACLUKN_00365 [Bacilli bacterium]
MVRRRKIPAQKPHDWDKEGREFKPGAVGMLMVGDKHTLESGVRPNFSPRLSNTEFFKEFRKTRQNRFRGSARTIYTLNGLTQSKETVQNAAQTSGTQHSLRKLPSWFARAENRRKNRVDAKNMRSTNRPEAAQYVKVEPRKGWEASVPNA